MTKKCFRTVDFAGFHIDAENMNDEERIAFYNHKKKDSCDECKQRLRDAIFVRIPGRKDAAQQLLEMATEEKVKEIYPDLAWLDIMAQMRVGDIIDLVDSIERGKTVEFIDRVLGKFKEKSEEKDGEKDIIH